MLGVRLWQKATSPHPELARKLVHIGMGLTTIAFPWIFHSTWPVILLGALAVLALFAVRVLKPFGLAAVLGSVERFSLGEVYFPISVATLFCITCGQPLLYAIPLTILTLADAAGALIGVRYGQTHYRTRDGRKSAEGSTAFFITAFFSTHIPLLLFSNTGRAECLLIGLTVGFLVMLLEAIAWRGLDNLVVPLASYLLLQEYLHLPASILLSRFLVMSALVGIMCFRQNRGLMAGSAAIAAALVLYGSWALGGIPWLVPPALAYIGYLLLCPEQETVGAESHSTDAVIAVGATGMIWLFLGIILGDRDRFWLPYSISFAAQLALIRIAQLKWIHPHVPDSKVAPWGIVLGCCIFIASTIAIPNPSSSSRPVYMLAGTGGVTLAVVLFMFCQVRPYGLTSDLPRWVRQGLIGAIVSLTGLVTLWQP
jgi:phytol kinase